MTTAKTALAEPINDDKPTMAVKSDMNKKPVAETDPTKPTPRAAAKKEEPSPHEESIDEEEKLKAEVADKNVEHSCEDNSNEDDAVGEGSKHIKPSPEKHAAQSAAEAATTEESTDGDSQNSDEDPNPKKADRVEWQLAQHPQENQPPAMHVSTAASMVSKHKPKENEQNRNKGKQEEQMKTKDTTTEDDAEEEDTEEIAEWKVTKSDKPANQTPIHEEGGAAIDKDDSEAAKTTEEGSGVPTAEQVSNNVDGAATDSPMEELDEPTDT